jgi:hypothetical protein
LILKLPKARLPILALLALSIGGTIAKAQQQSPAPEISKNTAQVTFNFDRTGVEVPHFILQVAEDGSAHYEAEQIYPTPAGSDTAPAPLHVDRKLAVSRATTTQIFTTAHALNNFNTTCASSAKGIADTGTKTLKYTGKDGEGSCTYNYSQDKRVVTLTDLFQAIANTMDMGRKLDFAHRFDRLGLDAATASLVGEVEAGRAVELSTIAPTLKSIAQDSQLLERVRLRAARLLQQAQPSI